MKKLPVVLLSVFSLSGCSVLRTTTDVVKTTAHVGGKVAKVSGKVAKTTAQVAWETGKVANKGFRTVVYMAQGQVVVPLEKVGNSYYANVKLNRKRTARFLIDTGATSVQISGKMARKLGIKPGDGEHTYATIAGGHTVLARRVMLKSVQLGGAKVSNVEAIVFEQDSMDEKEGLLGISFLNHFKFKFDTIHDQLILEQHAFAD